MQQTRHLKQLNPCVIKTPKFAIDPYLNQLFLPSPRPCGERGGARSNIYAVPLLLISSPVRRRKEKEGSGVE